MMSARNNSGGPVRCLALDHFTPALVETAERAPSRLLIWLPSIVGLLLVSATAWAGLAELDIVATAAGRLVPVERVKLVQTSESGAVRAIYVRDGHKVRAGDPVIDLDPTEATVDRDNLSARLTEARVEAAGLRLALTAAEEVDPGRLPLSLAGMDQADRRVATVFARRAETLSGGWMSFRTAIATVDGELARLNAVRAATEAELAKLIEIAPLITERVDAKEYLVARGLAARAELLELRQRQLEIRHDQEVLARNLKRDDADLMLAAERRRGLAIERRKTMLTRLSELEPQIAEMEGELRKMEQRASRRTLLAPADGIVTELSVHTIGGVVREAETLMRIVPERERLEVEATVANRDVGFIHSGQSVAVKVDSFAYTRYGVISGRVLSVAADATGGDAPAAGQAPPQSPGGAPPIGGYRVRIALERDSMIVDGRETRLVSGMTVTADVRTGTRTALDYLFAPLTRLQAEALRER